MGCTKNPKKFLGIFKYEGEHNFINKKLSTFMYGDKHFILDSECTQCGIPYSRHFVTWDDMLRLGYTIEQCKEWQYLDRFSSVRLDKINKNDK